MKKIILSLIIFLLLVGSLTIYAKNKNQSSNNQNFIKGDIIVKVRQDINLKNPQELASIVYSIYPNDEIQNSIQLFPNPKYNQHNLNKIYLIHYKENINIKKIISELNKDDRIEYAELNYELTPLYQPNDEHFWRQWFLNNYGQQFHPNPVVPPGIIDVDIDAPEAWDLQTGNPSIIIGIIDSGIRLTHEDLRNKYWINPGEIPNNNIDDDNNGFIDDVRGWNFVLNNDNVSDSASHGTPVAGIAGAEFNNLRGVSGVCPLCTLMIIKVYETGGIPTDNAANGILYATDNGAKIISMSFGGDYEPNLVRDAILTAHDQGVVLVAGAGNNGNTINFYPAAWPEVIGVAALNQSDNKIDSSNYGTWIDISAPGWQLYTTGKSADAYYTFFSQTSSATPVVSGVAGLILSKNPTLTKAQVESIILNSCDNIDARNPQYIGLLGCGRVNAYNALLATPRLNLPGGSPLFLKPLVKIIDDF